MLKKLDQYIIKTFFGPFLFIFSVLFFIFIVNIIWIQLAQFTGKGLSYFQIIKLLFYLGVSVVKMVLPLTILLASIMTFGDFGERYELAAMKAAGISLLRIMQPLLIVVTLISALLYLFSNNIIPDFQKKAKNMLYNIAASKPALNFTAGQFIDTVPGITIKFDKIYGEDGEFIEGVFVHKVANSFENQQTIVAKKGKFVSTENKQYLRLVLYQGYIFEDNISDKTYEQRLKQENQAIKFDTLVSHFDVSDLINQAIEQEKITDDYQFQTYRKLNSTIAQLQKDNKGSFSAINDQLMSETNNYVAYLEASKSKKKGAEPFRLDTLKQEKKLEVLYGAYQKIQNVKQAKDNKESEIVGIIKYFNKVIMYQQRIISYSFTCIIFFLIGASLGSIIRKGGVGLPVVIAIIIFIIFYVMNLSVENMAWKGDLDPYLATWIPNLVLLPFSIWLTYKALTDSQVFDVEKYKALVMPFINKFRRQPEHQRYQ